MDVLLMCWPPGHVSKIHDHDESSCFVLVVEGSVTEKMTLCFSLYDLDEDGYLVPDELEQMLRAYMIGSAKLAAEAVDVMEIDDFDDDFDEDNWDDVQSVLPVSTAMVCFAVCMRCLMQTVAGNRTAARRRRCRRRKRRSCGRQSPPSLPRS